jgi:hypothetical protein
MLDKLTGIKDSLARGMPVTLEKYGVAYVIVGYDDTKQIFLVRPCGKGPQEVLYSEVVNG